MTDVLSTNQAFFNKIAGEYDKKNAATIAQLERYIGEKVSFIGVKEGSRFLDYACGTGMLSRVLASSVKESIGVDATDNMVKLYNEQARDQKTSSTPPRSAYCGNLADPSDPAPAAFSGAKFFGFDLAGVGLGWHHFDDCELVARRLVERLKPGGVLFVVDFASHEAADEQTRTRSGITHDGFSEAQIRAMFEGAGAGGDFAFEELAEPIEFAGFGGGGGGGDGHHHHQPGHDHAHGQGHAHGSHGHRLERPAFKRTVFVARGTKL